MVSSFYDIGGNLIDTANIYGGGMIGSNTEMAGISEKENSYNAISLCDFKMIF